MCKYIDDEIPEINLPEGGLLDNLCRATEKHEHHNPPMSGEMKKMGHYETPQQKDKKMNFNCECEKKHEHFTPMRFQPSEF